MLLGLLGGWGRTERECWAGGGGDLWWDPDNFCPTLEKEEKERGNEVGPEGWSGMSTILKDAVTVGLVRYRYDPGVNQACGRTNRELTQMLIGDICKG